MLSAVIIVIREVLEASILVAALLIIGNHFYRQRIWLLIGLASGISVAVITAWYSYEISELFDGMGQELQNAASLALMALLLLVHHWIISTYAKGPVTAQQKARPPKLAATLLTYLGVVTVALAVQRECAEVVIYISGFAGDNARLTAISVGSAIGAAIGISCGILLYYGLQALTIRRSIFVARVILALTAAGMTSQAILYLAQAGLVDSGFPLWDTSHLISETSVVGQFSYAVLGYEATPSKLQIGFYFTMLAVFIGTALYHTMVGKSARGVAPGIDLP